VFDFKRWRKIIENEELKFEIISYSKEGNEMKNGGNGNKFEIQIEGELKNQNNEKYEWKMMDLNNGKYLIFVTFNEIDLNPSPLQIQVFSKQRNYKEINKPKLTFGSLGNGNGQFKFLRGICVDLNDNTVLGNYYL